MSWTQDRPAVAKREIITFLVGGQEFGIDVMCVREIRVWGPATPIALAPPYIVGMINLRGAVLPILDFAARLGFATTQPTNRHAILVAQFGKDDVGLLVEGVSEIMTISTADIQPVPNMASGIALQFISGVVACEKRMISLIALEGLVPRAGDAMAA